MQVIPQELGELPLLRGFNDTEVLSALASRFVQQEFAPGDIIVQSGQPADQAFLDRTWQGEQDWCWQVWR